MINVIQEQKGLVVCMYVCFSFFLLKVCYRHRFFTNEYAIFFVKLHSRLSVGKWLLRNSDSSISSRSSRTCLRSHVNGGLTRGHRKPLAAERGLLLEHPLNVRVTRRLLKLLAVHSVPERIHHSNLQAQKQKRCH